MKNIILLFTALVLFACTKQVPENTESKVTAVFDNLKVIKYGADDYGMKSYVMAFLKRGPNRDQDSITAAELQNAHLKNIIRMANEGVLILAGPFLDDGEIRGIYIFNVETVEEAKALTATDPAIQAGRLEMELHPWYGSAALMEVTQISKTLAKKSIAGD